MKRRNSSPPSLMPLVVALGTSCGRPMPPFWAPHRGVRCNEGDDIAGHAPIAAGRALLSAAVLIRSGAGSARSPKLPSDASDATLPVWRRIAAECRRVGGEIFLPCRAGQDSAAVAAYLATRRSRASRLSGVPDRAGNSGSAGWPPRSVSQPESVTAVVAVSGVILCLRPFPRQL